MPATNERLTQLCLALSEGAGQNVSVEALSNCLQQPIASIKELSLDSRQANHQTGFVAIFGSQSNGHQYINQALLQECPIIIAETDKSELNNQVSLVEVKEQDRGSVEIQHYKNTSVQILVYDLRRKLGDLAKAFYFGLKTTIAKQPSVTAVTGTNGKTSVASLVAQWISLLDEQTASVGTLGINQYIKGSFTKIADTINTTPDVLSLCSQLHEFSQQGITKVAIEASSHGLAQNRLGYIDVDCGVFTNLSQDHLDYHHTMQEYAAAKRRLLLSPNLQYIVLNADDSATQMWMQDISANPNLNNLKIVLFSIGDKPVDTNQALYCFASNIHYNNKGCEFTLRSSWGNTQISLPLIGKFNVANFLAAAAALLVQSYNFERLVAQVKNLSGVAGRMELFSATRVHSSMPQQEHAQYTQHASILVDYAHTPDALQQALVAARAHTSGELICIFGCGGDRDKSKRAMMGKIANGFADQIIITQDNSRTEKPMSIIEDILKGMGLSQNDLKQKETKIKVQVELDRKQAIKKAWSRSQANDIILLAGKGHETYMEIDHHRIHYDERAFVKELLLSSGLETNNINKHAHLGGQS